MTTVTRSVQTVKHVVTLAWAWGFSDGFQGESWAEGYGLFAGERLRSYLAGHTEGRKVAAVKAMQTAVLLPSDFAAALGDIAARQGELIYCPVGSIDHDALERDWIGD